MRPVFIAINLSDIPHERTRLPGSSLTTFAASDHTSRRRTSTSCSFLAVTLIWVTTSGRQPAAVRLVEPECGDHICAGGPGGGYEGGQDTDDEQRHGHACDRERVRRLNPEQEATGRPSDQDGDGHTSAQSNDHRGHALTHDHAKQTDA